MANLKRKNMEGGCLTRYQNLVFLVILVVLVIKTMWKWYKCDVTERALQVDGGEKNALLSKIC